MCGSGPIIKRSVQIPGSPVVLFVDGTENVSGWEFELSDRIFTALRRRGTSLVGTRPYRAAHPEEIPDSLASGEGYNCLLLLVHGKVEGNADMVGLGDWWDWLAHRPQASPRLLAICICQGYDSSLGELMQQQSSFAPIILAPESDLTPRQAAAFWVKFFHELNLHCADSISPMMAQFAFAKARHLAKGKMKIRY